MKTAIYPGSFDPVTSGHLNIIRRAANIFDKLIVCVMVNAGKHPMFSLEERVELIQRVTRDLPNVEVDGSSELLAEYARRRGSCVVVKGLRAGSDFEKAVKTTCFLADMNDFAQFNEVYAKYFTGKPGRSCVAVKTLPKGVLVEVEVVAVLG